MLNIRKRFLTRNRCFIQGKKRTPVGIQIHSIGTGQGTAESLASYWDQSGVSCCVTYLADADVPGNVLQLLPENYATWADKGFGNSSLITIEMMESDGIKYTGNGADYKVLNEAIFKADILRSYANAVELCADICKRYGWNPQKKLSNGLYLISSHDEGRRNGTSSAHVDPTHVWGRFGLTMDKFRADVRACMDGKEYSTEPKWYRVRRSWSDEKSQIGAYEVLDNAKANCPAGYSVYDSNGKEVYKNEAKGTVAKSLNGLSEAEKIRRVAPLYQEVARRTGMLASVGLAQFCLESGYATTDLAQYANNLHGMKCSLSGNTWSGSTWDGVSKYNKRTAEQDAHGNEYWIYADFRKYPTMEDSIADRAAYYLGAKNGSQRRYPGIENLKTAEEQIRAIKKGGYATDVNYVSKLLNIVNRFNLTQYDVPVDPKPAPAPTPTPEPSPAQKEEKTVYRVQVGAFSQSSNANSMARLIKDRLDLDCFRESDASNIYVYCGSFDSKTGAEDRLGIVRKVVPKAFIKEARVRV